MNIEPTSTARSWRLRERRSRGVVMVAPVEVGVGGLEFLVSNGLLKQHRTGDRKAVGQACLGALEAWAAGNGSRPGDQGPSYLLADVSRENGGKLVGDVDHSSGSPALRNGSISAARSSARR